MRNLIIYIIAGAFLFTGSIKAQTNKNSTITAKDFTVNNDSLDEETFLKSDTTVKTRRNLAKEPNILKLDDKRYHAPNQTFTDTVKYDSTTHWYNHTYLQFGAGTELMLPPASNYEFDNLTAAQFGVGRHLDEFHSVRLYLNGAFGYQRSKDILFQRYGIRLDHLFNVSAYFNGYRPNRIMNVSTVLGLGYHHSKMKNFRETTAFEGHAGLQFRFFTGPRGYINIEPYVGIAQDPYDLSEKRNWREYDVFYGANINFAYYISNNLTPEARTKYLRSKGYAHAPGDENLLKSWQSPFFIELSNGVTLTNSTNLGFNESLGHNMRASLGKWFSPAIGLRFSLSSMTFTWSKDTTPASIEPPIRPEYTRNMHSLLFGIGAEAMIDPFGFTQRYTWDEQFGMHILLGGEMGWLMKHHEENKRLSCHSESYTAGVQLWTKLHDGLRLFVEPRYSRNIYKLPYRNVNWNKRFADDVFSANIGISMMLRPHKYLNKRENADYEESRFTVGAGGGATLMSTKYNYKGEHPLQWNASAFATYRFNNYSGARLAFEYMSLSGNIMSNYVGYNLDYPDLDYAPINRSGLWKRTFHFGLLSADYVLNLTNLFTNQKGRKWHLELHVGPTLAMLFGETNEMSPLESRQPNHQYMIDDKVGTENYIGANAGLHLSYDINHKVQLFLSPTFYAFKEFGLPESMTRDYMLLQTLNLGVQYSF